MSSEKIWSIAFVCYLFLIMIGLGTSIVYFNKRAYIKDSDPFAKRSGVGPLLAVWASAMPSLACASFMIVSNYFWLWPGVILGMIFWVIVVAGLLIYSRGDMGHWFLIFSPEKLQLYYERRRRIEEKEFELKRTLWL